jgi:hypothetical protein
MTNAQYLDGKILRENIEKILGQKKTVQAFDGHVIRSLATFGAIQKGRMLISFIDTQRSENSSLFSKNINKPLRPLLA